MVGLYFMSNLCIPSRLGQFEVKLMDLRKLQLGIYLEHHCTCPFISYEKTTYSHFCGRQRPGGSGDYIDAAVDELACALMRDIPHL